MEGLGVGGQSIHSGSGAGEALEIAVWWFWPLCRSMRMMEGGGARDGGWVVLGIVWLHADVVGVGRREVRCFLVVVLVLVAVAGDWFWLASKLQPPVLVPVDRSNPSPFVIA